MGDLCEPTMATGTSTLPKPTESPALDPSHAKGPPSAPPPPPLPPPPPPQPGQQHGFRRKRRVRSFYWKTIPEEKVRGKANIWTLAVRQQQYQIDVRTVEELFGQQEEGRGHVISGQSRPARAKASFKESKDEISILDSKRGMNVGIFLKQFKKSNHTIVEDIQLGNGKPYGAEKLRELQKLLPEEEEVKKLKKFPGSAAQLTLVDSFMFLLIQVPRFDVRIEAMVLQEEFNPSCAIMSREINVLRAATDELMTCEELHAILHLVLQAGNIMNAGGYAGNAVGFKLSSLLSLADTKANKPGMNLLHFVALEAQKKDENLLKFAEKLLHVQSATRISVENIEAEFSSLCTRTRVLQEKIQDDNELLAQLGPFLESSEQTLQDLKRWSLDLQKEGSVLIDFFCEDKATFKLDECFRIFQDFCLKFNKAVKDNLDRELKEAARQQRLRELEERRLFWTTGTGGQNGNFGRSSSENDVEVLTKEGLLDFLLHPRPNSPLSPLGRSASARRYHHRKAADSPRFCSLPRSSRPHQRKTFAWLTHQDTRELGSQNDPLETSPKAVVEAVGRLPEQSSGLATENDVYNNNPCLEGEGVRQLSVGVEVPAALGNRTDLVLADLEEELQKPFVLDTPPSSKDSHEAPRAGKERDSKTMSTPREEDEDSSTFSSTTCDTSLPLDLLLSGTKPVSYIIDCTEPDCSVMIDFSEGSPLDANIQSSLSSNFESLSTNDPSEEPSGPTQNSVTPSEESKTKDRGPKRGGKLPQEPASSKTKNKSVPARAGRPARTLTANETHNLRRVVPITKVGRASSAKTAEKPTGHEGGTSRRPLRDQSIPARRGERHSRPARHSSLPPSESKAECGGTPRRSSLYKPAAKPVRNVPRPPPEEKMCRSTMRALAEAQAKASGGSAPQTPTHFRKLSSLPSFARNTVASTSRTKKDAATQGVHGTPVKTLSRTGSQRASSGSKANSVCSGQSVQGEEKPGGSLRRVQSVRASARTPAPQPEREPFRKGSTLSERLTPTRQDSEKSSNSSRTSKPVWK